MNSSKQPTLQTGGGMDRISINKPPAIDFTKAQNDGAGSGDFFNQLDQLTRQLQDDQKQQTNKLKLDELGLGSLNAASFEDPVKRALREAQELMKAEKYREALTPLGRALQEDPRDPEALYLVALCQTNLNDLESALRTLLPLRQMRLDKDLAPRVQSLKMRIRNNMMLMVLVQNVLLIRAGRSEAAVEVLRRLIALDPEAEMYYFMLGGSLMMANKLDLARQTVDTGIRECGGASSMLANLQAQLVERAALKLLEPARDMARRGQPVKASERLRKAPTEAQNSKLGRQFDRYLSRIERSTLRYGSARQAPTNHKEMESFHFYLVGSDIQEATQHMQRARFSNAEKMLANASKLAPEFPYLSYLYASCIFTRLLQQLESRRRPNEKEITSALDLAYDHAVLGATDSEIKEANMLVSIIGQARDMRHEAGKLEPLIKEFQDIMNSTKRGIRSPQQLHDVHRRMTQLHDSVNKMRAEMHNAGGKQQLQEFIEVVDRNLGQLNAARGELSGVETVNALFTQFKDRMDSIKKRGGLKTWERDSERDFFQSLRAKADDAQNRTLNVNTRAQLKNLIDVIDQVLSQF